MPDTPVQVVLKSTDEEINDAVAFEELPSASSHHYGPMNSVRIDRKEATRVIEHFGVADNGLPSMGKALALIEFNDELHDKHGNLARSTPHSMDLANQAGEFWLISATDKLEMWPHHFKVKAVSREGVWLKVRNEIGM